MPIYLNVLHYGLNANNVQARNEAILNTIIPGRATLPNSGARMETIVGGKSLCMKAVFVIDPSPP